MPKSPFGAMTLDGFKIVPVWHYAIHQSHSAHFSAYHSTCQGEKMMAILMGTEGRYESRRAYLLFNKLKAEEVDGKS